VYMLRENLKFWAYQIFPGKSDTSRVLDFP
jgi:hypothetical protein